MRDNYSGVGFLIVALITVIVIGFVVLIWWRIFSKTGYSGVMSLLMLIPLVNFIMLLVLAWVRALPVVYGMLALGGGAWTSSNQNFQIAVQMSAPGWVRARAIAAYLLTFQGGQAIGSAIWGAAAGLLGDPVALTLAAAGLLVGLYPALRWPVLEEYR